MKSKPSSESWGEGLRLVSYCPVCETRYNPMEARMLGQEGDTHLLHVKCRKCHHSILAFVLVNQVGSSSVGLLTDLTYEDVVSFRANTQVNINDVIEIHETLNTNSWQRQLLGRIRQEKVRQVKKKQNKLKD